MPSIDEKVLQKKFPSYMASIELPACAREQSITVYRACKTGKIERKAFLNTYEENGFAVTTQGLENDPQEYSLSTYEKLKDVKRFAVMGRKHNPPWRLAKGVTHPSCGLSCRSKEWKKSRSSHVDWWLYESAEPWRFFEEITYDQEQQRLVQDRQC